MSFPVFDALLYLKRPTTADLGLLPMRLLGHNALWCEQPAPTFASESPTKSAAELVRQFGSCAPICWDIECWAPLAPPHLGVLAPKTYERLLATLRAAKMADGALRQGLYNFPVPYDRWRTGGDWAGEPETPAKAAWWREAVRKEVFDLAAVCDFSSVCCYTYRDQPTWREWLQQTETVVAASRAYDKPVYGFLMPIREDSENVYVNANLWRRQCRWARRLDGVILFGGCRQPWDENAPWWAIARNELEIE